MNWAQYLLAHLRTAKFQSSHSRVWFLKYHLVDPLLNFRLSDDGQWGADIFNGHAIGCNAVSWAPATQPGSLITPQQNNAVPGQPPTPAQTIKRFVSAGCDNLVKIWGYREDSQSWVEEDTLEGHTDWVRDVAWAPNIGLPRSYIATASQVRCCDRLPKTFVHTVSRTKLSLSGRKITLPHHGWKQLLIPLLLQHRPPPLPLPRAASSQTSSGVYLGVWLETS